MKVTDRLNINRFPSSRSAIAHSAQLLKSKQKQMCARLGKRSRDAKIGDVLEAWATPTSRHFQGLRQWSTWGPASHVEYFPKRVWSHSRRCHGSCANPLLFWKLAALCEPMRAEIPSKGLYPTFFQFTAQRTINPWAVAVCRHKKSKFSGLLSENLLSGWGSCQTILCCIADLPSTRVNSSATSTIS
jgi:hypothetical protein